MERGSSATAARAGFSGVASSAWTAAAEIREPHAKSVVVPVAQRHCIIADRGVDGDADRAHIAGELEGVGSVTTREPPPHVVKKGQPEFAGRIIREIDRQKTRRPVRYRRRDGNSSQREVSLRVIERLPLPGVVVEYVDLGGGHAQRRAGRRLTWIVRNHAEFDG